ncbi:hypothetical protein D0T49_08355 [Paludibacter sp. 221]|uniref:translocation/assembly module TamB domain-containing protein n=1 Tax=Paludibacter sp. 221 TaxID=2302939 RepID=UPI0013D63576|nr:hypothetical protein [Paludibacter sp. 221]
MQQLIAGSLVKDISSRINSKVTIGKVDYKFFNTISLYDVYVEDLQGDTLVAVDVLNARFSLLRFFKGKVIFHTLNFDGLYGNLAIDEGGENNFKFLIDAFSKPDKNKPDSEIEYVISNLQLKNTSFRFNNYSQRGSVPVEKGNDGSIDFNHLYFEKLNAKIVLDVFNSDSLSVRILNLSGQEQSGLKLTNLKTQIYGSNTNLNIPEFELMLPNSRLHISDISLRYDSISDFEKFEEKVRLKGKIHSSYVMLDDLGVFVPSLKNMKALTTVGATVSGRLSNLRIQDINIKYGESFVLNGNLDLNGLPDIEQTFVYGDLKELRLNGTDTEKFISDLMQETFSLPKEVTRLGTVSYKGNVTGFFSNLVIYGNLKTNIGSISTDVLLQFKNEFKDVDYNGTIESTGLNLNKLTLSEKVGRVAFNLNTVGSRKMNSSFQGVIDAKIDEITLYNYLYQDIQFQGEYGGNGFNGKLKVEDENISLDFNGLIDLTQELPVFDFDLIVKEARLDKLNILDKYPDSELSFNVKTNMTGNSLDNINGYLLFDSLNFVNKDKSLFVEEIRFVSATDENYTNFSVQSEYINGTISGEFKYSSLLQMSERVLQDYLPAIQKNEVSVEETNRIDLDLTLTNTEKIAEVFESSYRLAETSSVKGYLDENAGKIDIVVNIPRFISGEQNLHNTNLHIWGENQKLELIFESNIPTANDFWNFSLYTEAQENIVGVDVEWRNRQKVVNRGKFRTLTEFKKDEDEQTFVLTSILPSEIIISDSLWNIDASTVRFNPDKSVNIQDFRFGNQNQYLGVDGILSESQKDSLKIEMKDVDLGFISTLLNMKGFHLGGITTGTASVLGVFGQTAFDAVLSVKDLQLNHKPLGDASVFSTWDQQNQKVLAIASIVNEGETIALGECTYTPSENFLDILIDANRVDIAFLTPYFESILSNSKGYASGKLRIGGPLKEIRFDGRLKVDDGQVTVDVLGSTFYFNDTIVLTPTSIAFPEIKLRDVENNKVTLNGALTHDGDFRDFNYDLLVQTKNAQVANLSPGANDLFFGKAYAEASVGITGTEEVVNIRVNALTKPGTKVFIQAGSSSQATDAGFIQFVENNEDDEFLFTPRTVSKKMSNLRLNLQMEVTPDAEVGLIIDQTSGDMISGKGNGNIRVEYDDSQGEAKMYGSYIIESGNYLFTLQDVFRKEFKIESGSTVSWSGSPSNAQVNIRAVYSLTASLKDLLDEDLFNSAIGSNSRTAVPVNCILILTDNLMTPTINFDIVLPSSDEGVKQIVRNVINTEEMMTRQILYLLVFNKFYTPDYLRDDATNVGTNDFLSLATSTVSAQLNNLIAQFSNRNNLSFGFDMRRSDEENMEYQVDLNYQPNERWIVNGNFGYRDSNLPIANYNRFITDIDVEYLLTKSGKLRFKAYNHTVDRAQLREAKNTQGVGFMYKEDFDNVGDLFRYYWNMIKNIGKKKNKSEPDEDAED